MSQEKIKKSLNVGNIKAIDSNVFEYYDNHSEMRNCEDIADIDSKIMKFYPNSNMIVQK